MFPQVYQTWSDSLLLALDWEAGLAVGLSGSVGVADDASCGFPSEAASSLFFTSELSSSIALIYSPTYGSVLDNLVWQWQQKLEGIMSTHPWCMIIWYLFVMGQIITWFRNNLKSRFGRLKKKRFSRDLSQTYSCQNVYLTSVTYLLLII